ncbi:Lysosomal aspartic protease-like [Oopsacas minuta]|uniref:Lysosomal aspartic protease-like n=1 Tax=Oopsacas minuta TaxID=111878 RepID=A0AAV7JCV8_9METZ|nr:Lysosomal aspartic protease-like [Oopsacas minuta]
MYTRVCLLCIIVTLSLGYVASKPGVEKKDKIFSLNFDVINPRDRNCELMGNTSNCGVELSGTVDSAQLANIDHGMKYITIIYIGKDTFRVQLDTGSNVLWVCSDMGKDCEKHNQYIIDKKNLDKYKQFKLVYGSGGVAGFEVIDDVHVTKYISIKKQTFGAAAILKFDIDDIDGVMGLNMDTSDGHTSVFYNMIHQKLLKEPIFAMNLKGGKSSKDGGMITFGGRHPKLFVDKTGVSAPMIDKLGRTFTHMTSLSLGKEVFCSDKIQTCSVNVDSGGSQIFAPAEFVSIIDKILEREKDNEIDCKKISAAPTIEIMFGKQRMTLESEYYTAIYGNGKCYTLVFENPTKAFDWQFGTPFFYKFYIEFNFTPKMEHIVFWEKK